MDPRTFIDVIEHHAHIREHQPAISYLANGEDISEQLSYGELSQKVRQLAGKLQSLSLNGERAILLIPGGIDFVICVLACMYAHIIPVPAYPATTSHHLKRLQGIVNNAQPKLIITHDSLHFRLENLLLPEDFVFFEMNEESISEEFSWQYPDITGKTLALLQYTSGSCDAPKGVMVSHANLIANLGTPLPVFESGKAKRFVSWTPLFHDMGLIGNVLGAFYLGIDVILIPPARFIQKPLRWLQAISRYGATHSGAPNFGYQLCIDKITAEQKAHLDLSSWQVAYCGGDAIRAQTVQQFTKAFAECGLDERAFSPCYGLAEATLMVSGQDVYTGTTILTVDANALENNRIQLDDIKKPQYLVACGKPIVNEEIIIVEPDNKKVCPDTTIGEIWIAGANVAQGYWGNATATQDSFNAYTADTHAGPFLRTGDLGFIHQEQLYITCRLKDLLIIRGRNHHPQDIENTAEKSSELLGNAVAFTINDKNEEPALIVIQELRKRHHYDFNAVIENIRTDILLNHGISPHEILLVKERSIPRTSSGKLQRRLSKQWYLAGEFNGKEMG